jgi:hypothetical protein
VEPRSRHPNPFSASAGEVPRHLFIHVGPHSLESCLLAVGAAAIGAAVARVPRGSAPNALAVDVGCVSSCLVGPRLRSAGPRRFPVQPGRHGLRNTAAAGHAQHCASRPRAEVGLLAFISFFYFLNIIKSMQIQKCVHV